MIRASSAGLTGARFSCPAEGWPEAPALCKSLIVMLRSSSSLNSYSMARAFAPLALAVTASFLKLLTLVRYS